MYNLLGVVVVVGIGWFVARWKWRAMVARNREMRRRMALAAAETARAELEATASYHAYESGLNFEPRVEELVSSFSASSPARQVQSLCEVCSTSTTTRCKQCKSVHYCSGKCQIIHWRQGHRDECSILSARRKSDAGVYSRVFEFNHDNEFEGLKTAGEVGLSDGQQLFSNSIPRGFEEMMGTGTKPTGLKTAHMDVKIPFNSLSDVHASSTFSKSSVHPYAERLEVSNANGRRSASMNLETMKPASSDRIDLTKSGHYDFSSASDEKSRSSVSSNCSLMGSEDHSLSEPSTPSCSSPEQDIDHKGTAKINAGNEFINTSVKIFGSSKSTAMDDVPFPSNKTTGVAQSCESDFKLRHHSTGSKISVKNVECSSSLDLSSSEESKVPFTPVLENTYKEQKPTKHMFGCNNPQSLQRRQFGYENDRIMLEARKCQVNKLEAAKKYEFSRSSTLQLNSGENEMACKNEVRLMGRDGYPEAAASRNGHLNMGIVGQFGASHTLKCQDGVTGGTYKGSFSYEHFVRLYNWNEVELYPCGLINCGNSCYANAVLQCLVFTPPLTAYFLQGLHSKYCRRIEWCFSCEFEDLVKKAHAGRYPVSPERIMSKINSIGSHLVHGREEDAHEFLRYAIDCMQLTCLREAGAKMPTPVDEETTLLSFTFGGYLRSKIECLRCGAMSEQHERMMDLAVEIDGDVSTLEDALCQFTRSEILDGENKYQCCRCKSYAKAKKKLRVLEAPNVLTIALKRFQSGKYGKLNKRVRFPEILDLAPYMSGTSDKSPIYRLYGVVVHLDFALSGHYICYIQNNGRRWFEANDSKVEEVNLKRVLSRDAYMLFYTRLVRSLVHHHDPRKAKTTSDKTGGHPLNVWNTSSIAGLSGYLHKRNSSSISDESSSEYSSSFFSDVGSNGTETSYGESSSSRDNLDQITRDIGDMWD